MSSLIRFFGLVVVAVTMAGCATPRYETTFRYEPPASAEDQACIKG